VGKTESTTDPSLPRLSVIVPIRNEAAFVESCLKSVLAAAPQGGLEVLVVDGMSDDGTDLLVEQMAAQDSRVRLLRNPARFVPQSMNIGLEAARGEYLGRIDGHCLVDAGYFQGCLARLAAGEHDYVGGRMIHEWRTPSGRAIAAAMSSPVGVGSAKFRTGVGGECLVDTLQYGVYRRDVFTRIGSFDEAFVRNQDDELNLRLIKAGGRILLVPSLVVRYFVRDSLRQLARQYYQYGYWKWAVFRKHRRIGSFRQLAPALLVAVLAVTLLAAPLTVWGRWLALLVAVPYALAVAGEALRQGWKRSASAWRIAAAIVLMHLGYGAGLLVAVGVHLAGREETSAPTALTR
jgi:succinoglycan biosynthesis protein ExoA